ncbi:hypothetical protein ACFXUV_004768, partial [Salmonella enterica]
VYLRGEYQKCIKNGVSVLRAADCTSRVSIVLAAAWFSTPTKRNQILKTGTSHENNPVADKNAG